MSIVCLVFHQECYLSLICWLFILYWKVQPTQRNQFNAKLYIFIPTLPSYFSVNIQSTCIDFKKIFQVLSQQFEFVHLCQEGITCVTIHMLYGAKYFFFSIIVLLESIGGRLIVLHTVIEFSEAGRMQSYNLKINK